MLKSTGAVVSSTEIPHDCEAVLPQASVNVQVRTIKYEFGQEPCSTFSLTETDTALQLSIHSTPAESTVGISSHSTITSSGKDVNCGGVLSMKFMFWVAVAVLPQASVAVKVRTIPLLQSPSTAISVKVIVTVLHASSACAKSISRRSLQS